MMMKTQEMLRPIPTAIARVAPDGRPTPRQRRRILIDLCLRRMTPGTITSAEFLRRRTAMNHWPDLAPVLQGIPWIVTGGVATRAYMPERMTQDIDVFILRKDCAQAWRQFQSAGFHVADVLDAPYFVARTANGTEVDVICADFPWLEQAIAHPNYDPAGYPVLDLPYLILAKLMANRAVDVGDMTRMLGLASAEDRTRVRAEVARYSPDDSDDLEALILLGQLEFGNLPQA
jgi:hypothetical protein